MAPTHGLLIETQQPFPSSIFSTRSSIPRYGDTLANEAIAIMYVLNCSDPFKVRRAFLFSPKSRSTFECCLFQYRRMDEAYECPNLFFMAQTHEEMEHGCETRPNSKQVGETPLMQELANDV
jgi:hypothetical protein